MAQSNPEKKVLAVEEEEEQVLLGEAAGGAVGGAAEETTLPTDILDENVNILNLAETFEVDDEDVGGAAKCSSSVGPRHSESKKEMLKVVENTIKRLTSEHDELKQVYRQLSAGEAQAQKEAQVYRQMITRLENFNTDELFTKEFEKFFEKHFVNGGKAALVPVPKPDEVSKGKGAKKDDEGKKSDMEMD